MAHTKRSPNRLAKLNALLQQLIGEVISEYTENLPGLITITKVDTSGDFKWAKVWISIVNGDDDKTFDALQKNIYAIQGAVNRQIAMKIVPRIQFFLDTTPRYAEHINKLLEHIEQEDTTEHGKL